MADTPMYTRVKKGVLYWEPPKWARKLGYKSITFGRYCDSTLAKAYRQTEELLAVKGRKKEDHKRALKRAEGVREKARQAAEKARIKAERIESGIYDLECLLSSALSRAKKRSAYKGRKFTIDKKWIIARAAKNDFRCELTGIPFKATDRDEIDCFRRPWLPSLDRIDSTKGYTPNNVRIVCSAVNVALSDWGEEVFQQVAFAYVEKTEKTLSVAHSVNIGRTGSSSPAMQNSLKL